ncbi:hypothetical protein A3709_20560 [Halioglobus sp. HI00S01]|uniref:hypothetical protein n=1 Tax=Halioglobus sp. HI00S01 TaxID=1822214 RepID=UPI0007C313D3|nr:hypothetical protein [Halioglobus sp. HI00S01]KZX58006.1 hypothetical protein A3709_20560 [Halioglobus sp. HI00S01]
MSDNVLKLAPALQEWVGDAHHRCEECEPAHLTQTESEAGAREFLFEPRKRGRTKEAPKCTGCGTCGPLLPRPGVTACFPVDLDPFNSSNETLRGRAALTDFIVAKRVGPHTYSVFLDEEVPVEAYVGDLLYLVTNSQALAFPIDRPLLKKLISKGRLTISPWSKFDADTGSPAPTNGLEITLILEYQ